MHNQDGRITHFTDLQVCTSADTKLLWFLLTNLGRDEVILGYPWLTAFEPTIHWKDATLDKIHQPVIRRSGGGAIFGHPELPCWCPGTYRRWQDCKFGAGVHKSDSPKDHCSLGISSVGHEQNETDL